MSIIGVLLIACLAYLYFFVMKNEEQVEKGYQSYVKADYTQVLNDYKDLDGKNLDKEALYIYAKSYIETNKQGLEKDKKRTCLIALHQMLIKITYYIGCNWGKDI